MPQSAAVLTSVVDMSVQAMYISLQQSASKQGHVGLNEDVIFMDGINEDHFFEGPFPIAVHSFMAGSVLSSCPRFVTQEAGKVAMAASQFRLALQSANVASFRSGHLQNHPAKAEQNPRPMTVEHIIDNSLNPQSSNRTGSFLLPCVGHQLLQACKRQ